MRAHLKPGVSLPAAAPSPKSSSNIVHPLGAAKPLSSVNIDRGRGALLGSAVGDALGAPFEFMAPGTFRQRFPEPVLEGHGEMIGGGSFGWRPGEFTDDTQMAVIMAENILERRGIDPVSLWANWRAWSQSAADCGLLTSAALSRSSWRGSAEAAHEQSGRSAANGALMRVTGLALAYASAPLEEAIAAARYQAQLTHYDPAAGWGAAIATALIRAGIHDQDPLSELEAVLELVAYEEREAFASILSEAWHPDDESALANTTVWTCLAQAVWALRSSSSFEEAVVAAISLGHDADTVACVTGALAGSRYGLSAIPERWLAALHGEAMSAKGIRIYQRQNLIGLADQLLGA